MALPCAVPPRFAQIRAGLGLAILTRAGLAGAGLAGAIIVRAGLALAAVVVAGPGGVTPARAGTIQAALDRTCSYVEIEDTDDARFAAGVGVMSTEPDARQALFAGTAQPAGAETCASVISTSFCSAEYLSYATTALTNTMPTGAGSHFFAALGAASAASAPRDHSLALALGSGGALLGGILGSDRGVGGLLAGAAGGGAAGVGIGDMIQSGMANQACTRVQADFTALTARLISVGLAPQGDEGRLVGQIRALAGGLGPDETQRGEAMIEAMKVAADRIDAAR